MCLINYKSICEKRINLNIKSHKSVKCLKSPPQALPIPAPPTTTTNNKNTNLCSEFQISFYSFQSHSAADSEGVEGDFFIAQYFDFFFISIYKLRCVRFYVLIFNLIPQYKSNNSNFVPYGAFHVNKKMSYEVQVNWRFQNDKWKSFFLFPASHARRVIDNRKRTKVNYIIACCAHNFNFNYFLRTFHARAAFTRCLI